MPNFIKSMCLVYLVNNKSKRRKHKSCRYNVFGKEILNLNLIKMVSGSEYSIVFPQLGNFAKTTIMLENRRLLLIMDCTS